MSDEIELSIMNFKREDIPLSFLFVKEELYGNSKFC